MFHKGVSIVLAMALLLSAAGPSHASSLRHPPIQSSEALSASALWFHWALTPRSAAPARRLIRRPWVREVVDVAFQPLPAMGPSRVWRFRFPLLQIPWAFAVSQNGGSGDSGFDQHSHSKEELRSAAEFLKTGQLRKAQTLAERVAQKTADLESLRSEEDDAHPGSLDIFTVMAHDEIVTTAQHIILDAMEVEFLWRPFLQKLYRSDLRPISWAEEALETLSNLDSDGQSAAFYQLTRQLNEYIAEREASMKLMEDPTQFVKETLLSLDAAFALLILPHPGVDQKLRNILFLTFHHLPHLFKRTARDYMVEHVRWAVGEFSASALLHALQLWPETVPVWIEFAASIASFDGDVLELLAEGFDGRKRSADILKFVKRRYAGRWSAPRNLLEARYADAEALGTKKKWLWMRHAERFMNVLRAQLDEAPFLPRLGVVDYVLSAPGPVRIAYGDAFSISIGKDLWVLWPFHGDRWFAQRDDDALSRTGFRASDGVMLGEPGDHTRVVVKFFPGDDLTFNVHQGAEQAVAHLPPSHRLPATDLNVVRENVHILEEMPRHEGSWTLHIDGAGRIAPAESLNDGPPMLFPDGQIAHILLDAQGNPSEISDLSILIQANYAWSHYKVPGQWLHPSVVDALVQLTDEHPYGRPLGIATGIGSWGARYAAKRRAAEDRGNSAGAHALADRFALDLIPALEATHFFIIPLPEAIAHAVTLNLTDPLEVAQAIVHWLIERAISVGHPRVFHGRAAEAKARTPIDEIQLRRFFAYVTEPMIPFLAHANVLKARLRVTDELIEALTRRHYELLKGQFLSAPLTARSA